MAWQNGCRTLLQTGWPHLIAYQPHISGGLTKQPLNQSGCEWLWAASFHRNLILGSDQTLLLFYCYCHETRSHHGAEVVLALGMKLRLALNSDLPELFQPLMMENYPPPTQDRVRNRDCVAMPVLEITLWIRLAWNSGVHLLLPLKCWDSVCHHCPAY